MTLDERKLARQILCIENWKKNRCKGTIEACTGFGKTNIAIIAIERLLSKIPEASILFIVPTRPLKRQTDRIFKKKGLSCKVVVLKGCAMHYEEYSCDLLIIDEIHKACASKYKIVFEIPHKYILGLTATSYRKDGNHRLLYQYAPIVDRIPLKEARREGWVAEYTNAVVLFSAESKEIYDMESRLNLINSICEVVDENGQVIIKGKDNLGSFTSEYYSLKKKLSNLYQGHSEKEEWAIDKVVGCGVKSIVFFESIDYANNFASKLEDFPYSIYHSEMTDKEKSDSMDRFISGESMCMLSVKALNEGMDVAGLELGITMSGDSVDRNIIQRLGRVVRKEDDKMPDFYQLVIKDTIEHSWAKIRNKELDYDIIDLS